MKTTLDDAIAACEGLFSDQGVQGDSHTHTETISNFLQALKAKAEPLIIPSDAEGFMLECADQNGFDHIDDNVELMVVSSAKLIEFVKLQRTPRPIDMILFCPKCGKQHVDEPGDATRWANNEHPPKTDTPWTNPPHRSHLCHGCGHIWRPADVATNGVTAIKTKGKHDGS